MSRIRSEVVLMWGLALLVLAPGLLWFGSSAKLLVSSQQVTGQVSRHVMRDHKMGKQKKDTFTTVYSFEYGGETHEVEAFWGNTRPPKIGSATTVLVPSGDPDQAVLGGLDLMTCPSCCLVMGLFPLGLLVMGKGASQIDPETLADGVAMLKPEVAGVVAYQARRAALEKDPGTLRIDGTIVALEPEEKDGVQGWVLLAEGADRIYVSESLPEGVADHLVGKSVEILVSPDDPERYVVDWFPVVERLREGKA